MMDSSAWVVFPLTTQFVADRAYTASASSCQHSMTEYPPREARAVMLRGVVVLVVIGDWSRSCCAMASVGNLDRTLVRTDLKSIMIHVC
ncbi:hypothetical protein DHEL01_v200489 [Diaporthe helianthi]|uniref:Uncharacterized protein n=1 Tax=Diaporthe helianthi TaxID=158607 RepID=A0A2P5IF43_DIAHE|nr:hypothetical protein DHEL01_v200489 [Diaporthe helianthi]